MGYLLDTNTASYVVRGNSSRVRERLLRVPIGHVSISVITEAELRFGAAKKPEAVRLNEAIESFVLHVHVLPWDSEAAKQYAQLRLILERSGAPMGNLDMMIAAHALSTQAVLVTNDHVFRRIKHLKIEDWTR